MINKMRLCFTITFWLSILFCQGQELTAQEEFLSNSAADFMMLEDYESALSIYQELSQLKPGNQHYIFQLGICTFEVGDKPQSLLNFLKAYELGYREPLLYLYLSKSYLHNFDFDNALYYVDYFESQISKDTVVLNEQRPAITQLREQILTSQKILDKKLSVDIKNMGASVNSSYADYVPIALSNDSMMIFTSRRHTSTGGKIAHDGHFFEDIYLAVKNGDGEWKEAIPFPKFNSKHHDANVAVNKDATEMYIFKTKRKGDIYKSVFKGSEWSKPKKVKGINSRHWEGSICLSPSEDTIYFSSDRPGGYGGSDIYFAVKGRKGNWQNVQNLGSAINTDLDEDAPYLYRDGKTLFFSSRGHQSIGGYDVFSSKLKNNVWTDVKNVGFPINSIADDIYFHLNSAASLGYFTSFRYSNFSEKSIGEKDIFQIKRPFSSPVYFVFKGRVFDNRTRQPIPAIVTMINMDDTTQAPQRLVVDINSGKFRYDIKFETRYKINVEVAGKVYFSKELYYPYQPELFETFLDIPLQDIPVFQMALHDVINEQRDTTSNTILGKTEPQTIVLVRKVSMSDPELKNLLLSNRVPVMFRQKLFEQLQQKNFVDDPEEGNLGNDLLAQMRETMPGDDVEIPVMFARLEQDDNKEVSRVSFADVNLSDNKNESKQPQPSFEDLSKHEQEVVERIADFILNKENTESLSVIDEIYYSNLSPEERKVLDKLVVAKVQKTLADDSLHADRKESVLNNLYAFSDYIKEKVISSNRKLFTFDRDAWGILHTFESSRFKHTSNEEIVFNGTVVFRNSGSIAHNLPLMLADDRGMIYSKRNTDSLGNVTFANLPPGKRYHVLVNDYAIALLGQSRYKMTFVSMQTNQQDYLAFYNGLSAEEKRIVDRFVAEGHFAESEKKKEGLKAKASLDFDRLSDKDKKFIEQIRKYLKAGNVNEEDFFLDKRPATLYDQMDTDQREEFNILIASQVKTNKRDSVFYNKLTEKERGFISKIREVRQARKTLLEDVLISGKESDYWYVLDEISFDSIQSGVISLSGVINKSHKMGVPKCQVALMDEDMEIKYATLTDSLGNLILNGVVPGKSYKVLINTGSDIANLSEYSLDNLKILSDKDDFFSNLTPEEKRMIDRIIAIQMASEDYASGKLIVKDKNRFDNLASEERNFIERLRKYLFADSITTQHLHLNRSDNSVYYNSLTTEERQFINRIIIKNHYDVHLKVGEIKLRNKEKIFYEKLSSDSKRLIQGLKTQRRAESDIFAENPVLIADKAWNLLDSISTTSVTNPGYKIEGQILHAEDDKAAVNVPVMIINEKKEVIGIISTDSTGNFTLQSKLIDPKYFILAQSTRNLFRNSVQLKIAGLKIHSNAELFTDSIQVLIVYFDFDRYQLKKDQLDIIYKFLNSINRNQASQLFIHGHTDGVGPKSYNQILGLKRAEFVKNLLLSADFDSKKIKVESFGENKPVSKNLKDSKNRRVELQFILIP